MFLCCVLNYFEMKYKLILFYEIFFEVLFIKNYFDKKKVYRKINNIFDVE